MNSWYLGGLSSNHSSFSEPLMIDPTLSLAYYQLKYTEAADTSASSLSLVRDTVSQLHLSHWHATKSSVLKLPIRARVLQSLEIP
jgi:hypothetical protein